MDADTTREKIADALESEPATADELAARFSIPTPEVFTHVRHIARSSGDDAEFLVAPPTCERCGFDQFDDPLGQPSKCPSCHSEALKQAAFMIDEPA